MANSSIDLAIGVWTPDKLVNAAKKYMATTYAPGELALVRATQQRVMPRPMPMPMQGVGADAGAGLAVGAIAGALLILLGLRIGAAWYVGKQFGRPVSGALVGGIFGAPGLGVLSLFPPTAKPNK